MIARAWRRLFGRARAQQSVDAIVRWHRAKLAEARAQRDQIKAQRDRARESQAELKASLGSMAAEIADLGGRFTAADFHASEAERRALAPALAERASGGTPLTVREQELLLERVAPEFRQSIPVRQPPPADLAFATVASDLYVPGLEALIRSLTAVYPGFGNDLHVFHDGSIGDFIQRRLRRIHPHTHFHVPDMSWLEEVPSASPNHRRVGRLGYMNIEALGLAGYSRILLLDADLLVLDDISRLWAGDDVIVCADCGDRDFAVRSPFTGDSVLNSGVISLPARELGRERLEAMRTLAREFAAVPVCPTIDRFADQKIWNIHLKGVTKDFAPLNYNCNVKYLARSLNGHAEGVSILHVTGAKPWIDPFFLSDDLVAAAGPERPNHPRFWLDTARRQLMASRLADYRAAIPARRAAPRTTAAEIVIVPADPARVPPPDGRAERIAPAQFVLNGGDPAAIDHLVLPHAEFGGWNAHHPALPASLVNTLRATPQPPSLWAPFYFRELFEAAELDGVEVNYLLLEQPFRRYADATGRYEADPDGFLDDLRDDALTLAIPAALAMGFRRIVVPPLAASADARAESAFALARDALGARGVSLDVTDAG